MTKTHGVEENLEAEARKALEALRAEIGVKGKQQLDAWDWAEDVSLRYVVDEVNEERLEKGHSLRGFFAADLAYRLGVQLQEISKDAHPSEEKEVLATARAAKVLAKRLSAIAESEGLRSSV
jgi:hypothetical protein